MCLVFFFFSTKENNLHHQNKSCFVITATEKTKFTGMTETNFMYVIKYHSTQRIQVSSSDLLPLFHLIESLTSPSSSHSSLSLYLDDPSSTAHRHVSRSDRSRPRALSWLQTSSCCERLSAASPLSCKYILKCNLNDKHHHRYMICISSLTVISIFSKSPLSVLPRWFLTKNNLSLITERGRERERENHWFNCFGMFERDLSVIRTTRRVQWRKEKRKICSLMRKTSQGLFSERLRLIQYISIVGGGVSVAKTSVVCGECSSDKEPRLLLATGVLQLRPTPHHYHTIYSFGHLNSVFILHTGP